MGVLIREVATLYNAYRQHQPSPLLPLPIQYGDFTLWQRQWLQESGLDRQRDYWLQQLADAPKHLHLPTDHPRPAVQTFRGRTQPFTLHSDRGDALQHLCQTAGVTPFMALLSVYALLLSTYCRQKIC
ncbi:MAG: hypothetical protein HC921_20670 [Synechococcaceae cyanobacterium SM2_3_1]|nr:hypothetical protein [Synechococcaceae cyanobacterium SM2_3_1]